MTRWFVVIAVALAAAATGCGGALDTADSEDQVTVTGHQPDEPCRRPRSDETLVSRRSGGFTPHSTLLVRTDGFAWASAGPAFGGPRCYQLSPEALADLRSGLQAADLATLDPEYRGSPGPASPVVEIVTATVTADGVTVYAESNAATPGRFADLLEQLGEIEGLVIRNG